MHDYNTAVTSDVFTESLPSATEVENCVPMLMSVPRRHFTCFLRTKSDGAIGSSSSISSQMSSVVDATNKPLAVTFQAMSGSLQDQNKIKSERRICDVKLKKRAFEAGKSNSTEFPTPTPTVDTEVMAKSVRCEYEYGVGANNFQQKQLKLSGNDDRDSCQKLPPDMKSSAESSDSFPPMSAVFWNGRFAGSTDTSIASAVTLQKMTTAGHLNVTTSPLSTSNIVNVNHPCLATGQNNASIRRRVIVIKRRPVPSTTVYKQLARI